MPWRRTPEQFGSPLWECTCCTLLVYYFSYTSNVHERDTTIGMADLNHKHLKLEQRKIGFAKRYFGVKSEQEAIDQALSLLMEEERLVKALKPLQGTLKGDERPWPYNS